MRYLTLILVPGVRGIPLTERQVKGQDHTWFAFGNNPSFGVKIPALATSLPTVVEFEGQEFTLTPGLTGLTKDGVLADGVRPEDQRPKTSGTGPVQFENEDGTIEIRTLTVSISETKDGNWNVVAKLNRQSTSNGGGRKVTDLDALWANLK